MEVLVTFHSRMRSSRAFNNLPISMSSRITCLFASELHSSSESQQRPPSTVYPLVLSHHVIVPHLSAGRGCRRDLELVEADPTEPPRPMRLDRFTRSKGLAIQAFREISFLSTSFLQITQPFFDNPVLKSPATGVRTAFKRHSKH